MTSKTVMGPFFASEANDKLIASEAIFEFIELLLKLQVDAWMFSSTSFLLVVVLLVVGNTRMHLLTRLSVSLSRS